MLVFTIKVDHVGVSGDKLYSYVIYKN